MALAVSTPIRPFSIAPSPSQAPKRPRQRALQLPTSHRALQREPEPAERMVAPAPLLSLAAPREARRTDDKSAGPLKHHCNSNNDDIRVRERRILLAGCPRVGGPAPPRFDGAARMQILCEKRTLPGGVSRKPHEPLGARAQRPRPRSRTRDLARTSRRLARPADLEHGA